MTGLCHPSPCFQSTSSMWSVNVVPNVSCSFGSFAFGVVVRLITSFDAYMTVRTHMYSEIPTTDTQSERTSVSNFAIALRVAHMDGIQAAVVDVRQAHCRQRP